MKYPQLRGKTLFQRPYFWQNCQTAWETKDLMPELALFNIDFDDVRHTIQSLYFPICASGHWYVGIVSFEKKQIAFADSLNLPPPANYYEIILHLLQNILKIDTTHWYSKVMRWSCPSQTDGWSCGVVALSFLHNLCDKSTAPWCSEMAIQFRVLWLRRIIEHHQMSVQMNQQFPLQSSSNSSDVHL